MFINLFLCLQRGDSHPGGPLLQRYWHGQQVLIISSLLRIRINSVWIQILKILTNKIQKRAGSASIKKTDMGIFGIEYKLFNLNNLKITGPAENMRRKNKR